MTSKLRRSARRSAEERGFTLIELLVVIIILGILAAVVVFAVSGVVDKGKSSATVIDERTIQTAEEAYCAQNSTYASGQQLVDGRFLSELPKYHQVNAQPNQGGPCNGWRYWITRTDTADAYAAGRWDSIPGPASINEAAYFLVRLRDGRVLAGGYGVGSVPAAETWDPNTGAWSATDPPPWVPINVFAPQAEAFILEDDPRTPDSECRGTVDNCGKVLIFAKYLFDPRKPVGSGQWQTIPSGGPGCRACGPDIHGFNWFQIKGTAAQCGPNCGKVVFFKSQGGTCSADCGVYDIYDPRTDTYESRPYPGTPPLNSQNQNHAGASYSISLADGRVLICCAPRDISTLPAATFFDPLSLDFSNAAPPALTRQYQNRSWPNPAPVVPNGTTFFPDQGATPLVSGIYTPEPGGPGSFRDIPSCVPNGTSSPRICRPLSMLLDGRVLAVRTTSTNNPSSNHEIWLYNPASEKWTKNSNRLNNRFSVFKDTLLLDPAEGPCGNNCGKVLTVGSQGLAELYSP